MRFCHSRWPQRNPTPDTVRTPFSVSPFHRLSVSSASCRTKASSRRGFALLITVTLLAFLVLLMVSLASLTRVETQVAANNTQLSQARANALFALNLAVGQLQKYAGPDQAVTARADIDAANTNNPLWTGVWDARPPVPASPTHAAAPANNAPMTWLVSGNETSGTAITPATAAVADPATGNDNVWLVRKVLGQELSAQSPDYPQDGRVKLAKTLIQVPAGQLPGFATGSNTPMPIGAYAWWAGDEGIKAKVNLTDPYRAATATDPESDWRREAAPRPGLEMLTANVLKAAFTATTDAFEAKRSGLIDYQQLPLLSTDLGAAAGVGQAGRYFNDLTSVGYGVLADTLHGGLRRDLTRGLSASPTVGSTAATEIGDGVAVFTLPTPGPYGRTAKLPVNSVWTPTKEPHAPTWDEVRAWVSARASAAGAMDPVSAPLADATRNGVTCPTTTGHAIMPVIVQLELGYGLDVGPDSKFRVMMRPRVILMNPYNVTLNSASYNLVYQPYVTSNSDLDFDFKHTTRTDPATTPPAAYSTSPSFLLGNLISLGGTKRMAFNITDGFAPGEIKVYSLASAGTDTLISGTASIVELAPGLTTNRAYFATGVDAPAWYVPAERNLINVSQGRVPRDHPRLTLGLGTATAASVPAASITTRYIQTSSNLYAKPHPTFRLDNDADPSSIDNAASTGRQLRTLRYTLRHAELDTLTDGSGNMATEGEIGGNLSADTSSGARFLIDNNPRAIVSQRIGGRDDVAHYAVTSLKGAGYTDIDYEISGANTLGYWGGSTDAASGSTSAVLFDVLRQGEEIVSLGRLGQVNWGVDGKHPAYPLGNSFASVFYPAGAPDFGHALNEATWDRFFLSTLPTTLATRPANLSNSRLRFHDPAGVTGLASLEGMNGYQLAATRLLIDGAFNINSTSVEAWAAFLGSVQESDYAYAARSGNRTDSAVRVFPRLRNLHDPDPTASGQSGNMYEWTGYRRLDVTQLRALAVKIVDGIKARGRPSRSLAEFINRDLSRLSTDTRNQMGIVQAAIDAVINTDFPSGGGPGLAQLPGLNTSKIVPVTFALADNPDAARGKLRSAGAPGFLLQSDLLAPLAPAMAARSDTFRVRTYGESRNPATGEITARAWCEAIVQRTPEFVGGEAAELRLDDAALGTASKTFGRKFVVTQFRWLGPEEI